MIRHRNTFTPRELFSRMQGAWFEPRQGSMWQENTGVTPTTSGGQTIGLLLDQSQGAVLGPELVTNGDFSNWTTGWSGWNTNAQISVINGQMTVAQPVGGNQVGVGNTVAYATVVGRAYQISLDIISYNNSGLEPQIRVGNFNGSANTILFNLSAGTGRKTGIFVANSTTTFVNVATSINAGSTITFDNVSVRQILGNHAYQSTAANRPIFGVRRNLLTYSEQFDNAAWTAVAASIVSVDGAFKLIPNNITANSGVYQDTSASNPSVVSIYAKKAEFSYLQIITGILYANFDLNLGVVGSTNATSSITPMTDGWYRCVIYGDSAIYVQFSPVPSATASRAAPISGNGVNGLYLNKAQLELGSIATTYQKITTATDYDPGPYPALAHDSTDSLSVALPDLGGGIFSSYGSVYFATPQGMSALHNQSIGTAYTLPALNTNIYGWCVFPARLVPPLEQRLALYMHRLAGIADADFFWQEDYGTELVTNGDFSNGTTGWTSGAGSSISVVSGELEIANAGTYGNTYQTITTVAGKTYAISGYVRLGTTSVLGVYVGTVAGGTTLLARFVSASFTYTFVASAQTTYITFINQTNTVGHTSYIDNISVREVLDGQVGQLLTDDGTILLRG